MERKANAKDWRGELTENGTYRIDYDDPLTVMEILQFGPSSAVARAALFLLCFGTVGFFLSRYAYTILNYIRGKDLIFFFLGLLVLGAAFGLGKKVGRPFGIILKWIGMPLVFLGIYGFVLVRLGFAAFLVAPVDLYLGIASVELLKGEGYGAFRGFLAMLVRMKASLLKGTVESSVLTLLTQVYRQLGATMNFYLVIPLLILISLGIFLGTVLLVEICGWITLLIPAAACYGLERLIRMLDEMF